MTEQRSVGRMAAWLVLVLAAGAPGCVTCQPTPEVCASPLPRELNKMTMPTHVIEPPDILIINAVKVIPKPPYRVAPLDVLFIQVAGTLPNEPIVGPYTVETDGTVNLGVSYRSVKVVGLSIEEAKKAVEAHLKLILKEPVVSVSLAQAQGLQQIRGEHLVKPDGTVDLGTYGNVYVAGMTTASAKAVLESHLSQYLLDPEITVEVSAYNSKVYYVIFDGAGFGEQVIRLPITGNETVLDAIAQLYGLTSVSSKHKIWIARPKPACAGCDQILPVDWCGIAKRGRTETNYQLLPGDRIYVDSNPIDRVNTALNRLMTPIERVFSGILLGDAVFDAIVIGPLGAVVGGNFAGGGFLGF